MRPAPPAQLMNEVSDIKAERFPSDPNISSNSRAALNPNVKMYWKGISVIVYTTAETKIYLVSVTFAVNYLSLYQKLKIVLCIGIRLV